MASVRHIYGQRKARRERARKLATSKRRGRFQHTLQEIAGSTFASFGTNFFVIEERRNDKVLFKRTSLGKSLCNRMATAQVIEPARINPLVFKTAKLRRLRIKQLDIEIQKFRTRRRL